MKRWFCGLMTIAAVLASAASARAASPAQIRHELASVVSKISSFGLPGGVIGVTGGPIGRYRTAFGVAAPGVPMTLGDHFRIGSITKTFTATVILKLVEQRRINLNWTISRWEPKIPNAKRITIRMLLDMTSGIWDEGGSGPLGQPSALSKWVGDNCHITQPSPSCGQYWKPQQLINFAIQDSKTYGPAYPPGVFYYSDTNYMLLGIIAHKVTGVPLGRLMKRYIFDPLHLRHTSFPTHSLAMPQPAAVGYTAAPPAAPTGYKVGPQPSPSLAFGAGNVVSTLGDLTIWARALGTGTLLRPGIQRLRLEVRGTGLAWLPLAGTGLTTGLSAGYGLGVINAGGMLGHNGVFAPPGYSSELWYVPKALGTVIVLFNSLTQCNGGLESDTTAATLAEFAFPRALKKFSLPGFQGVGCPTLSGT
jgi:D-alanyl-D-alanine carboxypeptidase